MEIVVRYRSIDGARKRGVFKTLEGARRFAQKWVGRHPDTSWTFGYAVSADGVGTVEVSGATISELFPPEKTPTHMSIDAWGGEDAPVLWMLVPRSDGRYDVYARTLPDEVDEVVAEVARTGRMDARPHPSGHFGPVRFTYQPPAPPWHEVGDPVVVDSPEDATPIEVIRAKGPGAIHRNS